MKTISRLNEREAQLKNIQDEIFDCLVIGGGITGSGVARDLAGRKISCILLDKDDFASGTSSKSGKLIHGGLRYLRYGQISMVLESCLERNRLLNILAPHIARPISFVLPFFKESKTPRWLAAIGLFLYDLLSLFKNTKNFEFINKNECHILGENFKYDTLTGALRYWDSFCHDARLVIETLKCARSQGAKVYNYAEVKSAKKENNLWSVNIVCQISKQQFVIRTKTLVNCAGPWCESVEINLFGKDLFYSKLTRGAHLLIDRKKLNLDHTISVEAPQDKRNIYFIPWEQRVLIGTTDKYFDGNKDNLKILEEDKLYLLDVVNYYFPKACINEDDIKSTYVGIRPLATGEKEEREEQLSRDYKIVCHKEGAVSVSGGKLTTYRAMSQKIVDSLIFNFLPEHKKAKCNSLTPLIGAKNLKNYKDKKPPGLEGVWDIWCLRYGSGVVDLIQIVSENLSDDLTSFVGETSLTLAEIIYFVQFEWAFSLDDILKRRSTIHLLESNKDFANVESVALSLKKILGLSDDELRQEIENYKSKTLF